LKYKQLEKRVDLAGVQTIVYHLLGGEALAVPVEEFEGYFDPGFGEVCDTSEFNGEVHYFHRGNA
jgi:hypothetical protein